MMTKNMISRGKLGIILLLSAFFASCSEDVNKWDVDPSYDRLYRTTHFELEEMMPTSVILKFNGISNVTKYVFEFSLGDSLQFNNIVRTEEVKADTLTPYSEGKVIVQNEYKKVFEDLNGTTRYSVRVKGVNEDNGAESGWFGLSFKTPAEQIFTGVVPGIIDATANWEADKTASTIKLGTIEKKDTTWINTITLTDAQKRNGQAMFEGLNPGTTYVIQIFNGEFLRGSYNFTTLGSAVGQTIDVKPGDNLNDLLAAATDETVTLIFTGDTEYPIGNVSVPANIKNLYFSGTVVNGKLAHLQMPGFGLQGPMQDLHFQYVDIDDEQKNGFWWMIGNTNCFENVWFTGCVVRNIPNCLIYISAEVNVNSINIEDCILDHISTSGWGMFNISKANVNLISFTNSTIKEIGDQVMDLRVPVKFIKFDYCTFCNYEIGMPKWIRIEKQPGEMQVTNMIFTGNNGEKKLDSGYGDYSAWMDFSGCYLTSDFVPNKRPFTNATILEMTSEELFVDPRNGDFHIKPDVVFRGKGKVGDPRWWK